MISLETDRLIMRNFRSDDWPGLQDLVIEYQASDSAKYEAPWPTAEEDVKRALHPGMPVATTISLSFSKRPASSSDSSRSSHGKSKTSGCTTLATFSIPATMARGTLQKPALKLWDMCLDHLRQMALSPARILPTSPLSDCLRDWACKRSRTVSLLSQERIG